MAEKTDNAERQRRARDMLMVCLFMPGLEARHDHFHLTRADFEAYNGISVADVLAALGPGWTTREVPEISLVARQDGVPEGEPDEPLPVPTETVFRREIGWQAALDQIMDRLPVELRHARPGSVDHEAETLRRLHPSARPEKLQ